VNREKLAQNMGYINDFSAGTVKTIGTLELLGGIGVVLLLLAAFVVYGRYVAVSL
jgi:hypothetical protein